METLSWAAFGAVAVGCILLAVNIFLRKESLTRVSWTLVAAAALAFIPVDVHRDRMGLVVWDAVFAVLATLTLALSFSKKVKA